MPVSCKRKLLVVAADTTVGAALVLQATASLALHSTDVSVTNAVGIEVISLNTSVISPPPVSFSKSRSEQRRPNNVKTSHWCGSYFCRHRALDVRLRPLVTTLWMALAITASAWFFYCVLGLAICAPLGVKSPGFALPTVLGTITGSAAILFVGWVFPANVLTHSFIAAMPFALLNTLGTWLAAYQTGYLRSDLKLWPTR
jgi:hypothetical protein